MMSDMECGTVSKHERNSECDHPLLAQNLAFYVHTIVLHISSVTFWITVGIT